MRSFATTWMGLFGALFLGPGSTFNPCRSMHFCMKDSRGASKGGFPSFAAAPNSVPARPAISRRSGSSSSGQYREKESVRSCPFDVVMTCAAKRHGETMRESNE